MDRFGRAMRFFDRPPFFEKLVKGKKPPICRLGDLFFRIFDRMGIVSESGSADVEHADGFLQCFWKRPADRHHFANAFHFSADASVCRAQLLDIPARDFDDDVIERRLEKSALFFLSQHF